MDAACIQADFNLFFATGTGESERRDASRARLICSGCSVRTNCLVYGLYLQYHQSHKIDGIWGGKDDRSRKMLLQEYEKEFGRFRDSGNRPKQRRKLSLPHFAPKQFFDQMLPIIMRNRDKVQTSQTTTSQTTISSSKISTKSTDTATKNTRKSHS